jgi:type II secretory pathway predicted ATPase ExeA
MTDLTIEQRFALQRARYEVARMSRHELERTAVKLLKSRMQQKNGVQSMLLQNGVVFKIEERQEGLPEIISEDTFMELLQMQSQDDDDMPTDIMDVGWEDDDIDNDGLMMM